MRAKLILAPFTLGLGQSAGAAQQKTTIYGYINSEAQLVGQERLFDGTGAVATDSHLEDQAFEMDVPSIHLAVQSTFGDDYKGFINIYGNDEDALTVSNAWVESRLLGDKLIFRLGKFYWPFDLYNEILDATPAYMGIEPPEVFDEDHLMLTRTTNIMFHGTTDAGRGLLRYSLPTGTDERGGNEIPIGVDLRYLQDLRWTLGTSFYTSNGKAQPVDDWNTGVCRTGNEYE